MQTIRRNKRMGDGACGESSNLMKMAWFYGTKSLSMQILIRVYRTL